MFIPEIIIILVLISISLWLSLIYDVFDYFMYVMFVMMFILAFIGLFVKNYFVAIFFGVIGIVMIGIFIGYRKLKDH